MTDEKTLSSGSAVVADDLGMITSRASAELSAMAGDSLLLVGGGGFLGYYLVQTVLAWNSENHSQRIALTIYDNWIRGTPRWLENLKGHTELDIRTIDITRPLSPNTPHYEWVIHAASIASPTYYREHPIETMDANVNGLRNLLEYGRGQQQGGQPIKGFLFFSTSEIYGDPTPDAIPTPESYRGNVSCIGPRACYDESKRYGETLSVNFARVHQLPVKIVRPFNNYGPGLKISDGRVLSDFAGDVLHGRDIVVHSSGAPTRTFCYIADAIVGYYKTLVNGRSGEPYNIGTDAPEISIADLAERVASIARKGLGYRGSVVHKPSDDSDYLIDSPNRRCPEITKAGTELGFRPQVSLDDGLWRSLLWYRDIHPAEVS